MITLSEQETDALVEICNIGMSKAAKQLSILLNDTIEMSIPKIVISDLQEIGARLSLGQCSQLAVVSQNVSGNYHGDTLLLFHNADSKVLTRALLGNNPILNSYDLRKLEHGAMIEIGNIIISACMSCIADFLKRKIMLSVPSYSEGVINEILLKSVGDEKILQQSNNAVALTTVLHSSDHEITGALVIILKGNSMETLLADINQLLSGQ